MHILKFFTTFAPNMPKKTLYHIIEWSVALAACAFLIYKIATYGDYPAMGETLRAMSWPQWLAIVLCIALMPVNMAIEAWRWKTLLPMPFIEAQRQVYYSKLAGLITPWRLGEYPARGVLMSEGEPDVWSKVLSMGVVGSATMTAAIVLAGAVALAFSPAVLPYLGGSYLYALAAVVLLLAIAFALMPKALRRFAEVNPSLLLRSLAQSLVRLLCWCVQLALVLYALGAI
ncbi:MAG: flippase-like domain-containing protein, partial [Desulfovibrionaceae bacterium]|nr:flippase-like domain-containing protein [Desulfovibrionaceae bacterium]